MTRWFTSDLHFGHRNVIEFCARPYRNVKEMDEKMIEQWNSQVLPGDEVWMLGDFGINKRKVLDKELVNSLNGRKHIVIGNHDSFFVRGHENILKFEEQYREKYINAGWEGAYLSTYVTLKDGTQVHLSHLPPDSGHDNRYSKFKVPNDPKQIYLHGHLHSHYIKKDNLIDVAFDANLILMSEQDIIDTINDSRTFIPSRLTTIYEETNLFLMPFENEVKKKNLRKVSKGNLVLYNYTDHCTYERAWNEVTRHSRGIIMDRTNGKIVALPFPKFFNVGEMPETRLENLPDEPYMVTKKMDGSLGIIYYYNDRWNVATRGSLDSDQAKEAEKMLEEQYDTHFFYQDYTYLVEIIYPENKIVANYGDERKLVLLAVVDRERQKEILYPNDTLQWAPEVVAGGLEPVEQYNYTIEEMIELQKTLPKDEEGFVVRFQDGLRVKIKGEEYMRIHRMIAHMTPLAFWDTMELGAVNVDYLQELPEEYRVEAEEISKKLEKKYADMFNEIYKEYRIAPKTSRKELGMYIQSNKCKHGGAFFSILEENNEKLERYIMKKIRPTGNVL